VVISRPDFPDILDSAADLNPPKSLDGLDFSLHQPYVGRWQLNLDQQLGRSTVLQLTYVGSRGVHLSGQLGSLNPTRPEVLEDGRLYFPPDTPRINPAFESIGMRTTGFNSHYHSVSAGLRNRFGRRLGYLVKYTYGKSIDEASSTVYTDFENSDLVPTMFDFRMNRGRSDFDLQHVFSAQFSYQVPDMFDGWAQQVLGNWQILGIAQVHSGHPFAPRVGFDQARLRGTNVDLGQRPDLAVSSVGSAILGGPDQYFDPTAFSLPAAGFYGDLGRGTLNGPGLALLDLAVQKALWQEEDSNLRFRVEFFNILNHPNFQIPSGLALFNSRGGRLGTAGRIAETSTSSRQIQLALRFEF
jgi:hypothetical protein